MLRTAIIVWSLALWMCLANGQWSISDPKLIVTVHGGKPTYSLGFNSSNDFYVQVAIKKLLFQNTTSKKYFVETPAPQNWSHAVRPGPVVLKGNTTPGISAIAWTNVSFPNISSKNAPMMISEFYLLESPPTNLSVPDLPLPDLMPQTLRSAIGSDWHSPLSLNKRSSLIVRTIAINMPIQGYPGHVRFGVETHLESSVGPLKVSYSRYPGGTPSYGNFEQVGLQGGPYKVETHIPPNCTVFCDNRKSVSVFHPEVKVTSISSPVASDAYMRWDSLDELFPNTTCNQTAWMFTLYVTLEPPSNANDWIVIGGVLGAGVTLALCLCFVVGSYLFSHWLYGACRRNFDSHGKLNEEAEAQETLLYGYEDH